MAHLEPQATASRCEALIKENYENASANQRRQFGRMAAPELIGDAIRYGAIRIFDAMSAEIQGAMVPWCCMVVQILSTDTVTIRGNARNNTYALQLQWHGGKLKLNESATKC